ncbi:MAG TPA: AI-2E family transporter [Ginsengibacter sp.]|nr:AI-2E family transporter [Ginsengibacter sp.]
MNANNAILQSYLKLLQITLLTLALMYFGKGLLIPLSFSLLLALILYPVCNWLEKRKLNRIVAIAVSITIVIIFFAVIMWLLIWQVTYLKDDLPFLVQKIKDALLQLQQWLYKNIGMVGLDTNWIESAAKNSGSGISSFIQSLFKSVSSILFSLFIIPVFTALFLYHREQFVRFLQSLTPEKYHGRLQTILHETSYTYYKYIVGLIKVYLVVGTLNSIGLLLLGVDHAILFGMLTAFMTMIPYVGIIISSMLPITVAWVTTNSLLYPLGVIAIFAFVQYLENSVIFPKIVGQQLNVSSWAILVALIAGGIVWGVSGMVLFMPFVAILKIISGYIEEWKPLNILLGREEKQKTKRVIESHQ